MPLENGVYAHLRVSAITLSVLKWKSLYYGKLHSQSVSLLSLSKLKIEILLHFTVAAYIDKQTSW